MRIRLVFKNRYRYNNHTDGAIDYFTTQTAGSTSTFTTVIDMASTKKKKKTEKKVVRHINSLCEFETHEIMDVL